MAGSCCFGKRNVFFGLISGANADGHNTPWSSHPCQGGFSHVCYGAWPKTRLYLNTAISCNSTLVSTYPISMPAAIRTATTTPKAHALSNALPLGGNTIIRPVVIFPYHHTPFCQLSAFQRGGRYAPACLDVPPPLVEVGDILCLVISSLLRFRPKYFTTAKMRPAKNMIRKIAAGFRYILRE